MNMNKYWKSIIFLGIYDLAVFVLHIFFNEPSFIGVTLILSVLIPIYIYAFKFSWPGVYIYAGFSMVIFSIYWLIYLANHDWYFYWYTGWGEVVGQFFLAPFFNNHYASAFLSMGSR